MTNKRSRLLSLCRHQFHLSLIIFIAVLTGSVELKAQNTSDFEEIVSNTIRNYNLESPAEKIYIHTDRSIYSSGQKLYYSVYLINSSTLTLSQLSKIGYVELFNGQGNLLANSIHYFEDGTSSGVIELPQNLAAGEYILKGYTAYMKNFEESFYFRKSISIIDPYKEGEKKTISPSSYDTGINTATPKPDIQFFPEGGSFVADSYSKLAFKGIDPLGYGFKYDGEIKDQNGLTIQKIESNELGMGSVLFTPKDGYKYTVMVDYDGKKYSYPLPDVKSQGYSLRASTVNGTVNIIGKYLGSDITNDFAVLIHNRGTQLAYGLSQNNSFYTRLQLDNLPEGIITISLIDKEGLIKCERLIYVFKKDQSNLNIDHDPVIQGTRSKVHVKLNMRERFKADSIKLSMSIVRPMYYLESKQEPTIRNYLLLTSELKGYIQNPGRYFDSTNVNKTSDMEALLLTQGWRQYDNNDSSNKEIILPEESLSLRGQMVNFYNNDKGIEGEVNLNILGSGFFNQTTDTDENGYFKFDELVFFDSQSIIFQGSKKRKSKKEKDSKDPVTLLVDSLHSPSKFDHYDNEFVREKKEGVKEEYRVVIKKINKIDSAYFVRNKVMILDEVQIVEDKKEDITEGRQIIYGTPSFRLNVDSVQSASSVFVLDLFRRLKSVQLTGIFPNYSVVIRGGLNSLAGSSAPLLLMDGIEVDLDYLYNIPASNIQFIDVVTGPGTAIYGSRGASGVIALYSRTGTNSVFADQKNDWGIEVIKMKGAQSPTSFYSPKFEADLNNKSVPMYFNTLYWNPNITIQLGEVNDIYFYTSDETADYKIILEGISSNGIPIHQESFITVE